MSQLEIDVMFATISDDEFVNPVDVMFDLFMQYAVAPAAAEGMNEM